VHRRIVRPLLLTLVALLMSAVAPATAYAGGAGSLDRSFAGDGTLTASVGRWSSAQAVGVQSDGKIVVAGYAYGPDSPYAFALSRFDPDGSLDPSFSGNGKVRTLIGRSSVGYDLAIQPDGKIVVVGYTYSRARGDRLALARYDTDGTLDRTFAGDGTRVTALGDGGDIAQSVAIQPDGKIVVAGTSRVAGRGYAFVLARYGPSGRLDISFGGDGAVTTSFGLFESLAQSVALHTDGSIVVGGYARGDRRTAFAVARYDADGALDPSFSANGKIITRMGPSSGAAAVAVNPDGKIVAAGGAGTSQELHANFALVRYNVDGSLDTSFAGDGTLTTSIGASAGASSVAIQADGKIVAAGASLTAAHTYDFAVARFAADGSFDASFSRNGKVTTSIGLDAFAHAAAIQSDGKIVLAGESPNRIALARYTA
jgi:uncharacterized delta-60 repeat protein